MFIYTSCVGGMNHLNKMFRSHKMWANWINFIQTSLIWSGLSLLTTYQLQNSIWASSRLHCVIYKKGNVQKCYNYMIEFNNVLFCTSPISKNVGNSLVFLICFIITSVTEAYPSEGGYILDMSPDHCTANRYNWRISHWHLGAISMKYLCTSLEGGNM